MNNKENTEICEHGLNTEHDDCIHCGRDEDGLDDLELPSSW